MPSDCIDPYGAAEYLITGVKRELISADLSRMCCYAAEDGQNILRVKLLIPVQMLITERQKLSLFIDGMTPMRTLM